MWRPIWWTSRHCRACRVRSGGSVALDSDAMQHPTFVVVGHGVVLARAVVEKDDRGLVPFDAALKIGQLHMRVEETQDGIALRLAQVGDAHGRVGVHEERLATGLRMRAHDWMAHRRHLLAPGVKIRVEMSV